MVEEPIWTYTPERLRVWGAEVHLFPERVVGVLSGCVWFCLERSTGQLLWQRRGWGRANRIRGLSGNVLVATETRANDGPWAADFGVYGLSLETGRLLWTSHAPGGWGRFVRLLDFVPGFTNELRDDPLRVDGEEILTSGGRLLEAATGKDVGRREVSKELELESRPFANRLLAAKEVPLDGLGTLVAGRPGEPEEPGVVGDTPLRFYLRSPEGEVRWQFEADREARIGEPHYWGLSFDCAPPFLYLAAADRPFDFDKGGSRFRLLVLDLRSGEFVQDVPLGSREARFCEVEACDAANLLVGTIDLAGRYELRCFGRAVMR